MAEKELTRYSLAFLMQRYGGQAAYSGMTEDDNGDYYRADEADALRQREREEHDDELVQREERIAALEADNERLKVLLRRWCNSKACEFVTQYDQSIMHESHAALGDDEYISSTECDLDAAYAALRDASIHCPAHWHRDHADTLRKAQQQKEDA